MGERSDDRRETSTDRAASEDREVTGGEAAPDGGGEDDEQSLPPLLDVDEELERIGRASDSDEVANAVEDARECLARYDSREGNDREDAGVDSLIDDLDNDVTRIRELLDDGDAATQAEAIHNRIKIFRDTRGSAGETLSVADARLEADGERVEPRDVQGGRATLSGTLVNKGESGDAVVRLAFYDRDGALVRRVECAERGVGEGERRDVELAVVVPEDGYFYDATALDADAAGFAG